MIKSIGMGAAAFGAAALVAAGTASAAFPEKNITFIIPYGPGGGFDTYVRKIAPVMAKHLGGKVNVVPKNVAGAGGRKALNVLYRAKPDGYNIAVFNMPGMLLDKILGKKQSYDIDKFTWLGRIAQSKYVLTVGKKSPYQDIKSLQKFAAAHASIHNHFKLERHLTPRATFKEHRSVALAEWRQLVA